MSKRASAHPPEPPPEPKKQQQPAPKSRALTLAKDVCAAVVKVNDDRFKHMLRVTLGLQNETIRFGPIRCHEHSVEISLLMPDRSTDYAHVIYIHDDKVLVGPMRPTTDRARASARGLTEAAIGQRLQLQFLTKRILAQTDPVADAAALNESLRALLELEWTAGLPPWRPPCFVPLGFYAIPKPWCYPTRA